MVMARIYAICGEHEKAIDELDSVLEKESWVNVNYLRVQPWIDPFRETPRYKELMKKYALPNEST